MEKLVIKGGNKLSGIVKISGAKNAVLPIITASLLGTTPSTLEEIPDLEDVRTISAVLTTLGVKVDASKRDILFIDSTHISTLEAPYELVRKMRASFFGDWAAACPFWACQNFVARRLRDWYSSDRFAFEGL